MLLCMDHGLWEISISMSKHRKPIFTPVKPRSHPRTAVWIRLEHFPIEYYHHEFLKYVGKKLANF